MQKLEPRHLLAGDVGAELVDQTLVVSGDDSNSAIRVDTVTRDTPDSIGATGGVTSVSLDPAVLELVNLAVAGANDTTTPAPGFGVGFSITNDTSFEFTTGGGFTPLGGTIEHEGTVVLDVINTELSVTVGDFTIGFDPDRASDTTSGFFVLDNGDLDIILFDVGTPGSLSLDDSSLSIGDADLLVSPEFAGFLEGAELAAFDATGVDAGDAQIDADIADIVLRRADGGKTSVGLLPDVLGLVGLELTGAEGTADPAPGDYQVAFEILHDSTFVVDQGEGLVPVEGRIEHSGTVTFNNSITVGNFSIGFDGARTDPDAGTTGFFVEDTINGLLLFDVGAPGSASITDDSLSLGDAPLLVSPEFSGFLQSQGLAEFDSTGVPAGQAQIDAETTMLTEEFIRVSGLWIGGRTTVNGERSAEFAAAEIANIQIDLGGGIDVVRASRLDLSGDLTIDLGDGRRNSASVVSSDIDGVMSVLGGSGRDSVRLTHTDTGSLDINTGGHTDIVSLRFAEVDGDAAIDLGSGNDRLSVILSRIAGSADFDGGSGSDRFFSFFSHYGDLDAENFRSRPWWLF